MRRLASSVTADEPTTLQVRAVDEGRWGERAAWGDAEVMAALVRQMMAECRARLAAEDAGRDLARDGQAAELDVDKRLAAD